MRGDDRAALEAALPRYMRASPWFDGKTQAILDATIVESIAVPCEGTTAYIAFVHVYYAEGESKTYAMPLAYATGKQVEQLRRDSPHAVIAKLQRTGEIPGTGLIYDALWSKSFGMALLQAMSKRRRFKGERRCRDREGGHSLPAAAPVHQAQRRVSFQRSKLAITIPRLPMTTS